MSLGSKSNICTICKKKGKTEWHQIASHNHGFSNPNNGIELCSSCHSKTASSSSKGQGGPSIGNNQVSEKIPDKQKSREARVLAKQKSREGRVRKQKRTLERKDKQERITSRTKSL